MTNLEFYKEEIISKMYGGNSVNKVVSDLFWEHHDSEKGETSLRCILDWLCDEHQILDKEEKEYLSAVIRPFRNKEEVVITIIKVCMCGVESLEINIKRNFDFETILCFPPFEEDTMYKGMEANKDYTLKDLGL